MPGAFTGIGNETTITEQNSNVIETQKELTVQQAPKEETKPSSIPVILPRTTLTPSTSKPNVSRVTIHDVTQGEEEPDTTLKYHPLSGVTFRQPRNPATEKAPENQLTFDEGDAGSTDTSTRTSPREGYTGAMAPYDHYGYLDHPQPVRPIETRHIAPTPYPTSVIRNPRPLDYDNQHQTGGEMERVVTTATTHITNEVFQRTLPLSQIQSGTNENTILLGRLHNQSERIISNLNYTHDAVLNNNCHIDNLQDQVNDLPQTIERAQEERHGILIGFLQDLRREIIEMKSEVTQLKKGKGRESDLGSEAESLDFQGQPQSSRRVPQQEEEEAEPPRRGNASRTLTEPDDIPKGAKLKKPEPYSGKRGVESESFLMGMELYFEEYPTAFDDNRKIKATLMNMGEGEPSKWASPILHKYLKHQEHPWLESWEAFKEAFLINFGDPMKCENAVKALYRLQQERSVQVYASQFRSLKEDVDWEEKALTDVFIEGLKSEVKMEIRKQKISNPDIENYPLEKLIEIAIRTDDYLWNSRTDQKSNGHKTYSTYRTSDKPTFKKFGEQHTQNRIRFTDQRSCYVCGSKGHNSYDCPQKKKDFNRNAKPTPVTGKIGKIQEDVWEEVEDYVNESEK